MRSTQFALATLEEQTKMIENPVSCCKARVKMGCMDEINFKLRNARYKKFRSGIIFGLRPIALDLGSLIGLPESAECFLTGLGKTSAPLSTKSTIKPRSWSVD